MNRIYEKYYLGTTKVVNIYDVAESVYGSHYPKVGGAVGYAKQLNSHGHVERKISAFKDEDEKCPQCETELFPAAATGDR